MDLRKFKITCERCEKEHLVEVDFKSLSQGQINGAEPLFINFVCPDMALMYRVMGFVLDATVNHLKPELPEEVQERAKQDLKSRWGAFEFEKKLKRFIELDFVLMGVPEEYYSHLISVINTYCVGEFYPAMTGAGALGERILNRLVLRTRAYFKATAIFKKTARKSSFDNWDLSIKALREWKVISEKVATAFSELKTFRNDSIHYNENYDFEANSHKAMRALKSVIDHQFNYFKRTDLFWVFNVPGEIWVRSAFENDPFVKEFVLPHCIQLTPYDEPTANPPIKAKKVPAKPISDEDFISLRKNRSQN